MGGTGKRNRVNRFKYRYHGLNVSSAIEFPEWQTFASDFPAEPDVVVSQPAEDAFSSPRQVGEHAFVAQGTGRFRIRDGRQIEVLPDADVPPARLRAYLIGSAWGALLYQRGALLLHGSAVQTPHGAAVFCATRGYGKSTLAALLTSAGFDLISDDMCCLNVPPEGSPTIHLSTPRLKLCHDAVEQLSWGQAGRVEPFRAAKSHFAFDGSPTQIVHSVRSLFLLDWGDLSITRLCGFGALRRFVSVATWRGNLLMSTGDPGEHMRQCAELINRTPLFEFRRPRDFGKVDQGIRLLSSHLNSE